MANRAYRKDVHKRMTAGSFNYATADLRVILADAASYTPDTTITGHEFLSDVPAGARVAVTAALANVTVVDGVLDSDDVTLPDSGGNTAEYLVIYEHTGVEGTSRLGLLFDTATGLPIARDSVDDAIQWHATGIYAL